MAPSKLRKAIGAVKDQTSIGLAKVGSSTSLSDLDVAIVKATRHEEYPPDERYIREVLSLTTYSRTFVSACVRTISRRLSKTKNWVVALKTLMLIQRLLSEGDDAYEQEIFFATRRGTRLLNMSDFRDTSARSNSWDYSAFVRTYGLYLDEQLEFRMQARRGSHGRYASRVESEEGGGALMVRGTPLRDMKIAGIFSRINHLMQLLERFLACKPAGAAKENRIVSVALYPIVKESFQLYYDITEIMAILIERFMQLDVPEMVKVHEIFSRVSKQYDELDSLYTWSKAVGLARASEYPEVEKISQQRLDMMDDYIHEKSAMEQNRKAASPEPKPEPLEEAEPEQDINSIKALPPPLEFVEEKADEEEQKEEVEEPKEEKAKIQEEGDLLNLGEGAPTTQEHGDKLALALFDGSPTTAGSDNKMTPWEAFKESSSGDWETALVLSASHLSNQKVSLPGGFDTLILDGMYQQGAMAQAVASSGLIATGSSSSVALGSAGRPAMLALPAPPSAEGGATTSSENSDPFAASLAIPPPPYVQMSEMEKKQKFLIQEQAMWQQYRIDGMQGQVGLFKANQNSNPYNTGGYGTT
ncbi:ENTH/ANTH/VHS superfamily protein [Perilla frutescens var. hirtella]|uniref:ENTH/ANTH/VHS superfamily protein n=1 Tax=Perilla frutescens var. hirtella TaxID=608512 RepID=A0AAD4IY02_PERFH|nr:ENTH/ANTH/VHS superfamily protein [Perilla frutescens var. hirtella]